MAIIGVLIIGFLFLQGSAHATFACDSLLTPGPVATVPPAPPSILATATPAATPVGSVAPNDAPAATATPAASGIPAASDTPASSPSPSTTPQAEPTAPLGFPTEIAPDQTHVDLSDTIEYQFCPPTSGRHYNIAGHGPLPAAVYPKTEIQVPGGWVHNLEHGWVVVLYRCTGPDDCPSNAEMDRLQAFFDQAPINQPACNKEVLVARFDDMDTRFATLAWGRAMLTDDFNLDESLTFAQQWMDFAAPEKTTC